ncbi:alcohol dehydrogenase [Penicillium angulare]|uniref:alcohol dehydrogenase (NADP(+)) n=1 Tax=Penicillium angulare TaxID=116970 RepID=A0A9W9KJX1_9EURO|nr:alcohol dehydrogenase [Penicillium angulare]
MSEPAKTFSGWVAHDATSPLKYTTFEPKPFTESDIEIRITHCGICGTDIHTLRSGWAPADYPCVVGHEIIGIVTRIGSGVQTLPSSPASREIKLGDRVGVGAQSGSCLKADCEACADGEESYCQRMTGTYNARYPDKSKSFGGFAEQWRGPAHFVFKIPDSLPSSQAAPLLCAGVTVYSPLKKYGVGPGKTVGIVGIGGLGHLGILFAKALGAEKVVAISRSGAKKDDAEKLGADAFIATGEEKGWAKKYSRSLDVVLSTVSGGDMPFSGYLRLLKRDGVFVQVGAPEDPLPQLAAWSLIQKSVKVTGSNIGSTADIREMLELAAEKRVLPWVEMREMGDVNAALGDMHDGKARYRFVLQNGGGEQREAKL